RTGYTGEDGFEIMGPPEAAGDLLDRLVEAGCVPAGLAARDSLRLEAALALHGHDIDETTTPWEAGFGWAVELDHDFVGRDALASKKDSRRRRRTCIAAEGPGVIRAECPVFHNSEQVSVTTSGGHSPMLGKSIAMAYMPLDLSEPGIGLEVEVRGRRIPSRTVQRPFYTSGQEKSGG